MRKCVDDLTQMVVKGGPQLIGLDRNDWGKMFAYSGTGINDLGYYHGCVKIGHRARYALFRPSDVAVISLCGPKSCEKEDYQRLIDSFVNNYNANHTIPPVDIDIELPEFPPAILHLIDANTHLKTNMEIIFSEDQKEANFGTTLQPGTIIMALICLFLLILIVSAAIVDWQIIKNMGEQTDDPTMHRMSDIPQESCINPESKFIQVLLCFSAYSNYKKIFTKRAGENDTLELLNCVRVLSMGWVILGHVFGFRLQFSYIENTDDVIDLFKDKILALVYGGYFAVDTFFWIGGLLIAYLFLKEIDAKGSVNWVLVYAHRIWRILPLYMFVLFWVWAFLPLLGDGPRWYEADQAFDDCKDYWWGNLLFINNFLPDGKSSKCMSWSWYLANDMQFFIITPPILYLYHRCSRVIGWVANILLIAISIGTSAYIADHHDYNAVIIAQGNELQWDYIYKKPYCRVVSYALGVICGMILFSYRKYKKSGDKYDPLAYKFGELIDQNRIVRYITIVLGLALINFVIWIAYDAYRYVDDLEFNNWSQTENTLYISLSRFGFALGLSMIMMPLLFGHFRVLIEFMSANFWSALARLTLACYLVHVIIIYVLFLGDFASYYYSIGNLVADSVVITVLAYFMSIPFCLAVEIPMMRLEQYILAKPQVVNTRRRMTSESLIHEEDMDKTRPFDQQN